MIRTLHHIVILSFFTLFSGCEAFLIMMGMRHISFSTQFPEYHGLNFSESGQLQELFEAQDSIGLEMFFDKLYKTNPNTPKSYEVADIDSLSDLVSSYFSSMNHESKSSVPEYFIWRAQIPIQVGDDLDTLNINLSNIVLPYGKPIELTLKHEYLLRQYLHSKNWKVAKAKREFISSYIHVFDDSHEWDRNVWELESPPWIRRIVMENEGKARVHFDNGNGSFGYQEFSFLNASWKADTDMIMVVGS